MSPCASVTITVRAPSAALLATAAWNAMPGMPVVDLIDCGLEIVMSLGPEMTICSAAESPAPKISTIFVAPRAIKAPVFEADPPEPVVTPSAIMLSAGEIAGAGTTMLVPVALWPAATVITFGAAMAPPPTEAGAGAGAGVAFEDELLALPQPTATMAAVIVANRNRKS